MGGMVLETVSLFDVGIDDAAKKALPQLFNTWFARNFSPRILV